MSEWISISEEPPELEKWVLLAKPHPHQDGYQPGIAVGKRTELSCNGPYEFAHDSLWKFEPTHWMPSPELPKDKEGWIRRYQKLPEIGVLVRVRNNKYEGTGKLVETHQEGSQETEFESDIGCVLDWKPLPEPPKNEK